MKRIIFFLTCMTVAFNMSAQPGESMQSGNNGRHQFSPERYRQKLEEFVTREAGLTADEASKLFPLIHEMQEKQHKNSEAAGAAMRSCKDGSSEADYERAITKAIALDLENKEIERQYYSKFHAVLSWKKIHAVRIALWKFQMEALRRFTPHGNGGRSGHRGNHRRPVGGSRR